MWVLLILSKQFLVTRGEAKDRGMKKAGEKGGSL